MMKTPAFSKSLPLAALVISALACSCGVDRKAGTAKKTNPEQGQVADAGKADASVTQRESGRAGLADAGAGGKDNSGSVESAAGAEGAACGAGVMCGDGLSCRNIPGNGLGNVCAAAPTCGSAGNACCAGRVCNAGLQCGGVPGTCAVAARPASP